VAYCSRCGNQAKEGAQFCDRCGAPLGGGYQQPYGQPSSFTYTYYPERKDPLIAVILSILLPGVGQIYVGRVLRGVLILILLPLLSMASVVPVFFFSISVGVGTFFAFSVLATIIVLILYVWQIYDAYRLAEEHNRQGSPRR